MKHALAAAVAVSLLHLGAARAEAPAADVKETPACKYCGMDRAKFASSRMVVEYDDGTRFGACSLHCVAIDLATQLDKAPRTIWVADLDTRQLVDAEKASWVLGGSKPGVMTKRAKWAFGARPAAEAFTKANGGTIVAFEDAMRAAYDDMYQDLRMIREKRKAMRARQAPAAAPAH